MPLPPLEASEIVLALDLVSEWQLDQIRARTIEGSWTKVFQTASVQKATLSVERIGPSYIPGKYAWMGSKAFRVHSLAYYKPTKNRVTSVIDETEIDSGAVDQERKCQKPCVRIGHDLPMCGRLTNPTLTSHRPVSPTIP